MAARSADRLWCAGLVCATATAVAVNAAELGAPTYVITGAFADRPDRPGADDRLTAEHIEAVRQGSAPDPEVVAARVLASDEAALTLKLGEDHVTTSAMRPTSTGSPSPWRSPAPRSA